MTSNVVVSIVSHVCLASAALRHRIHRTLVTNDGDSSKGDHRFDLHRPPRRDETRDRADSALTTPEGAQQPETHNDVGVALPRAGRMDEAIVEFREAVRLNPTYTAARTSRGPCT
jgi:hypothetical protein